MGTVIVNLSCLASYDVSFESMVIVWGPLILLAFLSERKRNKLFREGRIRGVPKSNSFFDWMFYNYRDRE